MTTREDHGQPPPSAYREADAVLAALEGHAVIDGQPVTRDEAVRRWGAQQVAEAETCACGCVAVPSHAHEPSCTFYREVSR